jgi:hypothetical protein
MLFNSLAFAVFLPVVLAVYYCLRLRAQNLFLLATSYLLLRLVGLAISLPPLHLDARRLLLSGVRSNQPRTTPAVVASCGTSVVVNLGIPRILQVLQFLRLFGGRSRRRT